MPHAPTPKVWIVTLLFGMPIISMPLAFVLECPAVIEISLAINPQYPIAHVAHVIMRGLIGTCLIRRTLAHPGTDIDRCTVSPYPMMSDGYVVHLKNRGEVISLSPKEGG